MIENIIKISIEDIYQKILEKIKKNWARQTGRDPHETTKALLSFDRARYQIKILKNYVSNLKEKKLLELGSGYGIFLSVANKEQQIDAYGIEPSTKAIYTTTYKIAKEILKRSKVDCRRIKKGTAEKIPFPDELFNVVYSYYVLEHTNNHSQIIKESVRVLKNDGLIVFVAPNFNSFWEGHYGIPWLPFIGKKLAKLYVYLWGKDPSIIDELNFVTQQSLEKIVFKFPELKVISWGADWFEKSLQEWNIPDDNTLKSAKKILNILKKLRLLSFAVFIAKKLKMQTPIILVAKKISSKK